MIRESRHSLLAEFFKSRLALVATSSARGMMWTPSEFRGQPMKMDDVAVAVLIDNFIGKTCCMHVVIQKPEYLSRSMIKETFGYIFNRCGVELVFGLVDSTNKEAIDFDLRLGFEEMMRVPNGGLDGDLVILGMKKNQCRWILKKEKIHGQEESSAGT